MADISALERALVNADAAGDEAAARVLAGEITRMRAVPAKAAPDKYQQAAIDEQADLKAKGIDAGAGYTRRLTHGATLGADSTILAALQTPLEMFKRGIGPKEGYNYAKAREDQIMGDSRKNTGMVGTGLEVLSGAGAGMKLAQGGWTAARSLAPDAGIGARSLAAGIDAAGIGAFSGAMEGNGLAERAKNAFQGGAIGGLLGGATPGALAVAGVIPKAIYSNLRARFNPTGFGQSQVARGVSESGLTPQQIAQRTTDAANDGQGMFTVADAMGNSGQRMLASTARAPGQARTDVVDFLDRRQAGQGRRISNALAEGFDAPQTAAQTRTAMENARGVAADAEYGAVRNGAANSQVDVVPSINRIDRIIGTGPGQQVNAANDTVEGLIRPFRERLARVNPDDFEALQRIRVDMSDAVQGAIGTNRGRLLRQVLNELDSSLEAASPGFRQANRNFAQASRDIEAVNTGRQAAMRGRSEDTIPAFQGLGQNGQQAFRAGYSDPLIEAAQSAPFGANKARPLINDAFADEAAVMAPGNPLMQRRIGREDTMFQTRNAAMGNSKTVENAADDAAMGMDPTVVASLVTQIGTGNFSGALRTMLGAGQNMMTGNTPAVRQAVADILLTRGANVNPAQFQRMLDETVRRIQQVQQMARSMGRGAAGGLAVSGPGQDRPYTGSNLGPLRR